MKTYFHKLAVAALVLLASMTVVAAQERDQKKAVWVDMDGVSVPLPPKEHPRVFVRAEEIPALKLKMQTKPGKKILRKLAEASVPRTAQEDAAEKDEAVLSALRPDEKIPAWSFRFLQSIPGVKVILSGMSATQQMKDNLETFAASKPLAETEMQTLLEIAQGMHSGIPCTGCRYCVDHCPMGLDIPLMMETCSELRFAPVTNSAMRLEFIDADKHPSACIACGACTQMCPQMIQIPQIMQELTEKLTTIPKWADICREREEAARRLAAAKK